MYVSSVPKSVPKSVSKPVSKFVSKPVSKPVLLNGILLVNKPRKKTSAEIIRIFKSMCHKFHIKEPKIGHGGTLDPEAQGLLILGLGAHTKALHDSANKDGKQYRTTIDLSYFTTTDDIAGDKIEVQLPDPIPTREEVQNVLNTFVGQIEQVPSKYSAIRINGQRAYDLARQKIEFTMKSRQVQIHEIKLLHYKFPILKIEVKSSKGTYIRTLGHDIGGKLKTGGYLTELIRLKSGNYDLANSVTMDEIEERLKEGTLSERLVVLEKYKNMKSNGRSNGRKKRKWKWRKKANKVANNARNPVK